MPPRSVTDTIANYQHSPPEKASVEQSEVGVVQREGKREAVAVAVLIFAQMREEIPDDTANVRVVLCSKITNLVLLGWSSRGSSRA